SGQAMTNTIDVASGKDLLAYGGQSGGPAYTNDVSPDAALHTASSLAINFDGTDQLLYNSVVLTTLANNFGIEAWVKPNSTNGFAIIAYNGPNTNGWGLVRSGNVFQGFFSGVAFVGSGAAPLNTWTHLALVRASGVATLYVNGM